MTSERVISAVYCACGHSSDVHGLNGCTVKGCPCNPLEAERAAREATERAAFEAGLRQGRDEALPVAFADCEALIAAGLGELAEKEDEKAERAKVRMVETAGQGSGKVIVCEEDGSITVQEADYDRAAGEMVVHANRAACLREMSLAVSLGQFRTAETNERAIVRAHRQAAGVDWFKRAGKAGGEARAKKLSPARRKKIAKLAARARWAKKGERQDSHPGPPPEHGARRSRAPAHLRGAHRMKPPEELDRIADKVLSYHPKDKAKKLKTKARKARKGAKRGKKS